ncbi:glycosyltransferase family 2 protein [Streptococcus oralis]|jgi:putative glycosyltransferase|uniref:glycosyltransferase family 2 protein n=1 Tax=Streptococcus oralis TaxID=1303 RepID=UPI00300E6FC0
MKDCLLTIVMPSYNIQDYILKGIESFQQVNPNHKEKFEVLIVNDGSTDDTEKVAKEVLGKDSLLNGRVITKENGGHGSTINRGIQEAKGKFFKVIDGDDWIIPAEFEKFLDALETTDVDMIITDFTEQHVYNDTAVRNDFIDKYEVGKTYTGIPDVRIPMHSVAYKTSILSKNNIRLSEKTFYVDMQYTLFPLEYVHSFVYWNFDIYQYYIGRPEQSMNIESMKRNVRHHLTVTNSVLDYFSKIEGDVVLNRVVSETLVYLISLQVDLSWMVDDSKALLTELYSKIQQSSYNYIPTKKFDKLSYLNHNTNYALGVIFNPILKKYSKKKEKERGV